MEPQVTVSARSAQEAVGALIRHNNRENAWITIEPMFNFSTVYDHAQAPTEKFRITWRGTKDGIHHEQFTREVDSVVELNAVIQPILRNQRELARRYKAEQDKKERAAKKDLAKKLRQEAQVHQDRAVKAIKEARKVERS